MYQTLPINPDERDRFCNAPGLPPLNLAALTRQRPDALLLLADSAGSIVGRAALWWRKPPPLPNHHPGLIGHYFAADAAAAAALLQTACDHLTAQGCTLALGPMDGSTWQRYRLVTERGSEPPFFLEPDNPDDWPAHFTDNGFTVFAQYYSSLNTDLSRQDPRLAEFAQRIAGQGVTLRPLRLDLYRRLPTWPRRFARR